MVKNSEIKKSFGILVVILSCLLSASPAWAGIGWLEKAKLTTSDGAANDEFGFSVSISGDYAIVGAKYDDDNGDDSGSAYIFKRDGTSWVQQQRLTASDGAAGDYFGESVSISGDYAIVGSGAGSAYIFKRDGSNWVQQAKLLATDGAVQWFGWSVSMNGDYAIVGAWLSAYIFKRDGEIWSQQAKLLASDGAVDDYFGCSVSISGDYAIVGSFEDDDKGAYSGSAYIFKRDGTGWSLQAKLTALDGNVYHMFGRSVSINGDYAIVGSHVETAYIFKRNGATWSQQQNLTASDGADDWFGWWSVSISGDYAIVGAVHDDDKGSSSGSAYIFKRNGETWTQHVKLTASDGAAGDGFGICVSISSDEIIVGAHGDDDRGDASGSAYIFILGALTGELTLLAPNGGENLVGGSTYDITWDTNGVVENVFIEYSDNNGVAWKPIDTVANTGSYPWLVPDANSSQCLVRISDVGYPPSFDISDDVFRIYVCADWLTADLNKDCFVDFEDFGFFAIQWLKCGDPYDPNCQP